MDNAIISYIANADINERKASEIASQIAELVINKSNKLLDIVVFLQEPLTSDDTSRRQKALSCLSATLSKFPITQLSKNEVSVLLHFYLSKGDETDLYKNILTGISELSKMKYLSKGEALSIWSFLQNQYVPSKFLANVRYSAFAIMQNSLKRWQSELNDDDKLSTVFIETFLHVTSGEKDPRNLLVSFELNQQIISYLQSAEKYKQELFDVLFCYFPITFKPPKNDPYHISNDDLKVALRSAISTSTIFAEDAFSSLCDKLSASSPIVKNETLITLKLCIDSYKGKICSLHWREIWKALKSEIMNFADGTGNTQLNPVTGNFEVIDGIRNDELSLSVITRLSSNLIDYKESAFVEFFNCLFDDLKTNFSLQRDLKQSCSILASIGLANLYTLDKVIENTLPLFLRNTTDIPELKLILMNLSFFLDAYIKVIGDQNGSNGKGSVENNKMMNYKDEILMILSMSLTGNSKSEVTVRTLSIIQFTKLVRMKSYLTKEEVALIIQYLTETILTDGNKNIYHACLEGLKTISGSYEELIFDVSLKKLLELLSVSEGKTAPINDTEVSVEVILKVILDFTTSRHVLVRESIISLCYILRDISDNKDMRDYGFLLLSTMLYLLENNMGLASELEGLNLRETLEPLLLDILKNSELILSDDYDLHLLSKILFHLNAMCPRITHEQQLADHNMRFVGTYAVLDKPSRLIVPYGNILAALDREQPLPDAYNHFKKSISLIRLENSTMSEVEKLGYLQLLMILSNKWLTDEQVLKNCCLNDKSPINLEIVAWSCKGLLMRNSNSIANKLEEFVTLLKDQDAGSYVAKVFEVFSIDVNIMTKLKTAPWINDIKLLYKQKLFSNVMDKLLSQYREIEDVNIKSHYLTATSMLIKNTPNNVVVPFINELFPLLLKSLELPNSDVRASALHTLIDTTEKNSKLIAEHAQALVPLLLELTKASNHNTPRVRLLSLRLLQLFTLALPLNYCLQFRDDVINGLTRALSDNKRIVRKQCIDTRQSYFELGLVITD